MTAITMTATNPVRAAILRLRAPSPSKEHVAPCVVPMSGPSALGAAKVAALDGLRRGGGGRRFQQLACEEVHEQAVVPRAVAATLVLAKDADGPEPDPGVGPDRAIVVGRRVDRDPVVAAGVDQPAGDRPHRI